jgi:hypothetical protein
MIASPGKRLCEKTCALGRGPIAPVMFDSAHHFVYRRLLCDWMYQKKEKYPSHDLLIFGAGQGIIRGGRIGGHLQYFLGIHNYERVLKCVTLV